MAGAKGWQKNNGKVQGMGAAVATPPIPQPRPHPAHFPLQFHLKALKKKKKKQNHVLGGFGLGALDSGAERTTLGL